MCIIMAAFYIVGNSLMITPFRHNEGIDNRKYGYLHTKHSDSERSYIP